MARGNRPRQSLKTALATTKGGLVSQTMERRGRRFRKEAKRARQVSSPSGRFGMGGCTYQYNLNISLKIEMLTPRGEHSFALFYQGDVRWENQFRRNRNRQKLCSWILFPYAPAVKKKSARPFFRCKPIVFPNLREREIHHTAPRAAENPGFQPEDFGLKCTKPATYPFSSASVEM
jgi:hypothetical protein